MILKSIKLENIRSYLNCNIDFPTGSVLLSGDIGSGKSTILLAIEFALFGAKRTDLSGASLLRHGKSTGSVELSFELEGKSVIVKRVLKRSKDDIKQEAGYIIIDGTKKEGTHIELKSDILSLLGYPTDLVSKSKDLVYRYTVYTPQEDMKQIILEDKDLRLDTLRKVFNIDKYKRIRENAQIIIRDIKEKRKNYEGIISDLEEKKLQKKDKESEILSLDVKLAEVLPKLESAKKELLEKKSMIDQKEKDISELNRLKKELALEELKLQNNLENRKNNKAESDGIIKEIATIADQLKGFEVVDITTFLNMIKDKEQQLNLVRNKIIQIAKNLTEFETKKKHSNDTKNKVSTIDQCPVCLQKVGDDHKSDIHKREEENIAALENHIRLHLIEEKQNKEKITVLESELTELRQKQMEIKAIMFKKESLKEKENRKLLIDSLQEKIKQEIGKINIKKMEISAKIDASKNIEDDYKLLRNEFDVKLAEEKKYALMQRELMVKRQEIAKLSKTLDEEIEKKSKIKESLGKISSYQLWLEEHFVKLMATIEKHVMLQVYREFNDLFCQWFSMLIADETINVSLDDEFSPLVEQNGYETSIINLSGGEKTAVALAYRLALNRVINDIIGQIKTKDILILDEPTDGFSTEQLDKVRDVLTELNIKQVIIVSHESKIESFVDNVIKIEKREHVSEIS